jgi:Flp pilus assembly protein TadG
MLVENRTLSRTLVPAVRRTMSRRTAAAAVEFAVVAPLMFALVLGIIEFGRAMMVAEIINSAARNGCRQGVLTGSDNAAITTAVNNALGETGISGATSVVKVNGSQADARNAISGDAIAVTVSVAYGNVSWLPVNQFLGDKTLVSTVVMRRE